MRRAIPIAIIVGLVALLAWQVLDRDSRVSRAAGPLDYAPADTPWLLSLDEPLPDELVEVWKNQLGDMTSMQVAQLDRLRAQMIEDGKGGSLAVRLMGAVAEEMRGRSVGEVLDEFGLALSSRFAFYGVGLVPVFRMELANPAQFRAGIERLEGRVGETLPVAKVGEQEYWRISAEEVPVIGVLAVVEGQLVATLAPADVDDALLGPLLGLDGPARTSALAALTERRARYDFVPAFEGFVDFGRLLARASGEPSPLEQAFFDAAGIERPKFEPGCTEELASIATTFPGLSFGYTRMEPTAMDALAVLETSEALATDLMKLRAPMPGADAVSSDTLVHFGISLNLTELPELASRHARKLREAPFACEQLTWINESAESVSGQLANPAVYGAAPVFRGVHLIVDEVDFSGERPKPLRGAVLVGSDNPQSLVAMARSFVPGLASLELPADGSPMPVELPQLAAVGVQLDTFAATGVGLLGVAFGADASTRLPTLMATDPDYQPLLAAGYSGALFTEIAAIIEQTADELPPGPEQDEARLTAQTIRRIYGEWVQRLDMELELTERGIEFRQELVTR